jgi:hypothetical protein
MPLVRISYTTGLPPGSAERLSRAVHRALVQTFAVPNDDCFQLITARAPT